MGDLAVFEVLLSAGAVLAGAVTAAALSLVLRRLSKEQQRRAERMKELESALTYDKAGRVVVVVEYEDGRRKVLVRRPIPESSAEREDLERALQDFEASIASTA